MNLICNLPSQFPKQSQQAKLDWLNDHLICLMTITKKSYKIRHGSLKDHLFQQWMFQFQFWSCVKELLALLLYPVTGNTVKRNMFQTNWKNINILLQTPHILLVSHLGIGNLDILWMQFVSATILLHQLKQVTNSNYLIAIIISACPQQTKMQQFFKKKKDKRFFF